MIQVATGHQAYAFGARRREWAKSKAQGRVDESNGCANDLRGQTGARDAERRRMAFKHVEGIQGHARHL